MMACDSRPCPAWALPLVSTPMDIGTLEGLSLPDPTGTRHRLGDLWEGTPVVLVFLRHFG